MPRYEGDPTRVAAGLEVFPKDEYEFIVGEPKAFEKLGENGLNHGVRWSLTCVTEGPMKGKIFIQTNYQHSEAAKPMGKRFTMSVLGYGPKDEKRFDADFAGKDWGYDTDSGAVGDAWRETVGKRVIGDVDIVMNKRDGTDQNRVNWRPVGK